MGYELYRRVLHDAPAELGTPARLLVAVIADKAGDDTRDAWPGMELLCHLAGLSPDGVRRALRQLAEHGMDLRVPIGKDRNGSPVYATHGHQTTYRVPLLPRRICRTSGCEQCRDLLVGEGVQKRPPSDGEGGQIRTPLADEGVRNHARRRAEMPAKAGGNARPSPQEPSGNTSSSAPARTKALGALGATAEEEMKIIERLRHANGGIQNMPAYLDALANAGDLEPLLGTVRAEARAIEVRAVIDAARHMAPCEHGQPGGAEMHPTSREPLCPLCRAVARSKTSATEEQR